jgi:hypothetical protein
MKFFTTLGDGGLVNGNGDQKAESRRGLSWSQKVRQIKTGEWDVHRHLKKMAKFIFLRYPCSSFYAGLPIHFGVLLIYYLESLLIFKS